jgi:hypothetical protein
MIASTTWEEANCRFLPWIRQRSRWLKGYAVTWATHMRRPRELLADLGWTGFLGFQTIFLGALTSFLTLPLLWGLWIAGTGFGRDAAGWLPPWLAWGLAGAMLAGLAVDVVTATVAARDTGRRGLLAAVPLLFLYWPLGTAAAWLALYEVFTRPSHWHKTEHGVSPGARA